MTLRTPRSGFTLVEVMVAVAILGLALSAILSAQAGAYAATGHARNLSIANGLVRCKMSEVEEHLLRDGYQELDEADTGICCEGDETPNMSCSWRVEKPVLPEAKYGDLDLKSDLDTAMNAGKSALGAGQLNPLGVVGTLGQGDSTTSPTNPLFDLDGGAPPAASGSGAEPAASGAPPPGGLVGGLDAAGLGGLTSMVMSMVYPQLKTVFEASTRRITVVLSWTEGAKTYTLELSQWVTNPQMGGVVGEVSGEFDQLDQSATGPSPSPTGTGTGPKTPRPKP